MPRSHPAGPLAVLLVLAFLLSASGFLTSPGSSEPQHRAAELVGADGHREVFTGDGGDVVVETAHNRGGPLLASGPQWLALAEDDLESLVAGDFLRVSRTQRTEDGVVRNVSMQRLDADGVAIVVELDDDGLRVFKPGLVVLPADVQPGDTWRGAGNIIATADFEAVEALPYSFQARASRPREPALAEADCLTVERSETKGGQDTTTSTTWCPGRGVVREGTTRGAGNLPTLSGDVVAPRVGEWAPAEWDLTSVPIPLAPPMQWGTDLAPVNIDGALVLAHQTSGDVIFLPEDGPDAAWRVHPGGSVTMLSAFGNLVVASTTKSRLTAWDADGISGWEVPTRDLVSLPPVLLGTTLVVADDSGHLMGVDASTGEESWNSPLGDHLTTAPVACGDTVIIATTAPGLVALGPDGTRQWEHDLEDRADALACTSVGVAVAVGGVRLHHFALDSTHLASVPLRVGIVDALWAVGTVIVAQSNLGLSAHDAASGMTRVWHRERAIIDAASDGTHLVTFGHDGFTAMDAGGAIIAQWVVDVVPVGTEPRLVADVDSVLVLGADMTLTELR